MIRTALCACVVAALAGASSPVRLQRVDADVDVDPLQAPAGTAAIVFLFTSTDCPISNRYAPEVRRLASRFGPEGVVFRLIYPNPSDGADSIREHMASFAYTGTAHAFRDPDQAFVRLTGVTVTPEAVVYSGGRIVYRGRIDDRYVDLGRERPAPTVHDLADSLTAVLAGKPVPHPVTQAVGCFIADFKR